MPSPENNHLGVVCSTSEIIFKYFVKEVLIPFFQSEMAWGDRPSIPANSFCVTFCSFSRVKILSDISFSELCVLSKLYTSKLCVPTISVLYGFSALTIRIIRIIVWAYISHIDPPRQVEGAGRGTDN